MESRSSFLIFFTIILSLMVGSISAQAQSSKSRIPADVEYNATERSPTLPLQQTPPPQDHPNSVSLGTPSYYYYYVPGTYAAPVYPAAPGYVGPQGGASYYNQNGNTTQSFWYRTPIPGQMPLPNQSYPSFYGPGAYPPSGGGILYVP